MPTLGQAIFKRLEEDPALPTLPSIAEKLVGLWGNGEQPEIGDVSRVVAQDAAMAGKVLRYTNSAAFAIRQPARTVSQAVTMLGPRQVRNVVLSFALVAFTKGKGTAYRSFWRRSVLASVFAKELATLDRWVGLPAEEASLVALLQDIGSLALMSVIGTVYETLVIQTATNHAALATVEHERIGVDHCEIGGWLLRRWMFPEDLADAVALSHGGAHVRNDENSRVATLAAIAGVLADAWVEGGTARTVEKKVHGTGLGQADPLKAALARSEMGIQEAVGMFTVERCEAPDIEWLLERSRQIIESNLGETP
jgi:HD-like signal output (HDOD) protein